jgi:hypothetical protein
MSRLTVIPGWVKIRIEPITELPESMLHFLLNMVELRFDVPGCNLFHAAVVYLCSLTS